MGPDAPQYLRPEDDNPDCGDDVKVVQMIVHPEYDPSTVTNDLTLLVLDRNVKCADRIAFAQLDRGEYSMPGKHLTVAGWGALYSGKFNPFLGPIAPGKLHEAMFGKPHGGEHNAGAGAGAGGAALDHDVSWPQCGAAHICAPIAAPQ